ncbi:MAG: ABC transporter permease [Sphaerochaetaceae bacterium]|nr:ABC transporter permease [Sphaerochaetaceae bacterium]MDD3671328.1 ABC transporter permease [Sphaerochaetaceae bacterium]MDD4260260.1 ABC transporter permease [Sphaerochaetaceae bacterium]MDD4762507.1 ABC transporter permease [Sphaerochaetaceae bacterium]MDD4842173.1 ABC transporter permease [Sphaerochaetaceae bacterium]
MNTNNPTQTETPRAHSPQQITRDMFVPTTVATGEAEQLTRPSLSYWKDALRRFKKNKIVMVASAVLLLVILFAVFAPVFSQYTYDQAHYELSNIGPTKQHWFGTDVLGRDIWTRCWEGARVSLFIGLITALVNASVGILYGGLSGFIGGRVDNVMMRFCEIIAAVPQMLWITLLMLIMRPGLLPIIVALSATGWISMARLFRGQVFQIKESEFVMASKALGTNSFWIIMKHLVPNAMSPIITNMAFAIPSAIFAEAFLSYIGLGLPLPLASWGNLSSTGANAFLQYPYQLVFPSILICITMLSFNLIGDGLRDALDPRLRK